VSPYEAEPRIATEVTLETLTGDEWHSHPAVIADLTRHELWVAIDREVGEPLDPGRPVRLVLRHPSRPTQTAETIVLWHIGRNGSVVSLKRPRLWDPPSRREHARVQLSIPVYIRTDDDADPLPSMTTNVSVGGIFCVTEIAIQVAQRVDVSLQLTPARHFDCQAEVVRVAKDPADPSGRQRLIGLHFLDVSQEHQAALAQILTELALDVDEEFVPSVWRPHATEADA